MRICPADAVFQEGEGWTVWMDETDIASGSDWMQSIGNRLPPPFLPTYLLNATYEYWYAPPFRALLRLPLQPGAFSSPASRPSVATVARCYPWVVCCHRSA